MLALALQRRSGKQQVNLGDTVRQHHVGHTRGTLSHGAGLVQHYRSERACRLERLGVLDEDAVCRTASGAHHDGRGRGQAQRTRAADDQDRDGMRQCRRHIMSKRKPAHQRHGSNGQHHGHKDARDTVCLALDWRLRAGGLVHQANNLRKRRVVTNRASLHRKPATGAYGGASHRASHSLLHRHRLARDGALVHQRGALDHYAVHRHGLSCTHDDAVPHLHVLGGNGDLNPFAHHGGRLRRKVHQLGDGISSATLCARLKELAQRDERQDHARGVKVQAMHGLVRGLHVHVAKRSGHRVHVNDREHKACRRADGNERVHVGRAVPQGPKAAHKVVAVHKQDGDAQQELREGRSHHAFHTRDARNLGPAKHGAHRDVEERHRENGADDELAALLLDGLRSHVRDRRGGLRRSGSGSSSRTLRPRYGAVSRLLDGGHHGIHRLGRAVVGELHAVLEQVDVGLGHAGALPGRLAHARRARRARHSRDVERFFSGSHANPLAKLLEEIHDLVNNLLVTGLNALGNAGLEMVAHDDARDGRNSLFHSCELRENVSAVAVLLNHRLDAVELANSSVDAL